MKDVKYILISFAIIILLAIGISNIFAQETKPCHIEGDMIVCPPYYFGDYSIPPIQPEKTCLVKSEVKPQRKIFVSDTYAFIGYENYSNFGFNRGVEGGIFNQTRFYDFWLFTTGQVGQGKYFSNGMSASVESALFYDYKGFLFGGGGGVARVATVSYVKDGWRGIIGLGYILDYANYGNFKIMFRYTHSADGSTTDALQFDGILALWKNRIALLPIIGYAHAKEGKLIIDSFYSQVSVGIHI